MFSLEPWALITSRAIAGLACAGCYVVTPLYLKEVCNFLYTLWLPDPCSLPRRVPSRRQLVYLICRWYFWVGQWYFIIFLKQFQIYFLSTQTNTLSRPLYPGNVVHILASCLYWSEIYFILLKFYFWPSIFHIIHWFMLCVECQTVSDTTRTILYIYLFKFIYLVRALIHFYFSCFRENIEIASAVILKLI